MLAPVAILTNAQSVVLRRAIVQSKAASGGGINLIARFDAAILDRHLRAVGNAEMIHWHCTQLDLVVSKSMLTVTSSSKGWSPVINNRDQP